VGRLLPGNKLMQRHPDNDFAHGSQMQHDMQPYEMQCSQAPMSAELGPPDYWQLQPVSTVSYGWCLVGPALSSSKSSSIGPRFEKRHQSALIAGST